MEDRRVLNHENIEFLIKDPDVRVQMRPLLNRTDVISWVVRLCPSGKNFEVLDGVVTPCVTMDIPLTVDATRGACEMLGLLIGSMSVSNGNHPALRAWDDLLQRRKETRTITEEYYVAAEGVMYDTSGVQALEERAAAIGNKISFETEDSGETVAYYKSYTLEEYPFDPLTEPCFSTNGAWHMWGFVVPAYWHLLVALVSYDEHQVKRASAKDPTR